MIRLSHHRLAAGEPPSTWWRYAPTARRRARIAAMARAQDRARALAADRLLHDLTCPAVCSAHPSHTYSSGGRPVALTCRDQISASHDGGWVVAARSAGALGVDVIDASRLEPTTAGHGFTSAELLLAPTARARVWAAKEAFLKRCGIGLATDPRRLAVHEIDQDLAEVCCPTARRTATVRFVTLDPDHVLAICAPRTHLESLHITQPVDAHHPLVAGPGTPHPTPINLNGTLT